MIYTYNLSEQPNAIWCHNRLEPTFYDAIKNSSVQPNKILSAGIDGATLEIAFEDFISEKDKEEITLLVRKYLVADCDRQMLRIYNYIPADADFLRVDYDIL